MSYLATLLPLPSPLLVSLVSLLVLPLVVQGAPFNQSWVDFNINTNTGQSPLRQVVRGKTRASTGEEGGERTGRA